MDFANPGYDDEVAEQVIVNHHVFLFPVPTELKQVYSWIQKGKIWEDTEWQRIDAQMSYDPNGYRTDSNDIITQINPSKLR